MAPLTDRYGGLYGYLATQPATAAGFDALVKGNDAPAASALAQAIDFAKLRTVVDVGGGHSGFITAILQAHPGVRGILTELDRALPGPGPSWPPIASPIAATSWPATLHRPTAVGRGDYLLAHIIHNWNDEQALAILRAVRAAIPDDGRLLLVEAIIPDDDSPHLAKDLDIRLITILPGGGRTEPEYARLLAEAGFRPKPAVALARIESVMVAIPGQLTLSSRHDWLVAPSGVMEADEQTPCGARPARGVR